MDTRLASHLAYALTGAELNVDETGLDALAAAGWDPDRIRRHAAERDDTGERWPLPVPVEWLREHGAARWAALLGSAVHELGLDVKPVVRTASRPLTPDERRLLADVPPHHGA